jgi:hypothetical protein
MSDKQRRTFGFLVGVAFALPYLIISQFINVWALPGVPLFDFPVGRVESVILGTLVFGLMGMIIAWEEESLWGLILGSLFGVGISSVGAFLNSGSTDTLRSLIVFVFTFLPRLVLYLPLGLLFRWIINAQEYVAARAQGWLRRGLIAWIVLFAAAVLGARYSLYSPEARQALQDANALVQEGMQAESREDLPAALIPVDGFIQYAHGPYTLERSEDVDVLPVTRPRVSLDVIESLIIFRFENGYQFGCVYTPPSREPKCIHIHLP